MSHGRARILKAALSAMYATRSHQLLAPLTRGVGTVFMLHHVAPATGLEFEPNRILRITPEFLEDVIAEVRRNGFDIITMDEAHWRLCEGAYERPFVVFTLDDGYRDNFQHALPVFRRNNVPFTLYVASDFADGYGDLWWLALERVIGEVTQISLKMDGELRTFRSETLEEKHDTYGTIYWWLRGIAETDARATVGELCRGIGLNRFELCDALVMNWAELRQLCGDPLVSIGAHTKSHFALRKLSLSEARQQIEIGTERIVQELGQRPAHFAYPYGQAMAAGPREFALVRELGFKTAVTTRKGVLFPEHAKHLTALPRVSLNGDYQDSRFVPVFLSGAPFALSGGFKRVSAN